MRSVLILGLLVLISACGSEGSKDDRAQQTLPVEKPFVALSVLSDSSAVAQAARAWSESEGVDLRILPRSPGQQPPSEIGLVEQEDSGGKPWLYAPCGILVRVDRLQAAGQATRVPGTWEDLSRLLGALHGKGIDLGIPERSESLHRIFFPLYWAACDSVSKELPRLDAPAAEEAMAFLVVLSQTAQRLATPQLEAAFLSGRIALLPCDLAYARRIERERPEFELQMWPWPAARKGKAAVALTQTRSWEVPADSPQPELAASLAAALYSKVAARSMGNAQEGWTSAMGKGEGEADLVASLRPALRPWPRGENARILAELIDRACDAALDRRRSPSAALAEARAEFHPKADLSR